MAKVKLQLHIHAHFNTNGEFTGYNVATWKYDERVSEHGVTVWLFQHDVEVDVPEDEVMLKARAVNVVEVTMKAAQARHTARMTALLGLKNRMLCLAAPDILDAGTSASGADLAEDIDNSDIPF